MGWGRIEWLDIDSTAGPLFRQPSHYLWIGGRQCYLVRYSPDGPPSTETEVNTAPLKIGDGMRLDWVVRYWWPTSDGADQLNQDWGQHCTSDRRWESGHLNNHHHHYHKIYSIGQMKWQQWVEIVAAVLVRLYHRHVLPIFLNLTTACCGSQSSEWWITTSGESQ